MTRRILAVVGSPRRNGNTHILVSKIAEGARTIPIRINKSEVSGVNIPIGPR